MNIGLISREYPPETGWGGIGTYTAHLARGLAARGHQVRVIAQGLRMDGVQRDGAVVVHRIMHRASWLSGPWLHEWIARLEYGKRVAEKLAALGAERMFDVIEAPNLFAEGFVPGFRRRWPMVTRLHTPFAEVVHMQQWRWSLDRRLSCAMEDAAIHRSDAILCSTHAHRQELAFQAGLDPSRIDLVPLGIPLPPVELGDPLVKLEHPAILFVGRLERRKGVHVLLQAAADVLQAIPAAHLYIVGRDTYTDDRGANFEGEAERSFARAAMRPIPSGLLDRVHLLGYLDPAQRDGYLRACDVFAAPSLYESFGLVYLEAMAHGKPVVGCWVGGVPEVVEHGVTGYLVRPEDPGELAMRLIELLKDEALRLRMGAQARVRAGTFSLERMVDGTLAVYERARSSWRRARRDGDPDGHMRGCPR